VKIETLRTIGKRLLQEIPPQKKFLRTPLGIGASGDKTYPIDKFAEDIILAGLDESGESLTIISEEAGVKDIRGGGRRVLIDPIDGSRNAVAGIPFFCTSIAIADGDTIGDMELAYVVNLVNGDEFWAEKGRGAFLNSEKIHAQQDEGFYLAAYEAQSPLRDIARILPLLSESRKTRCLGATALDLSYLAAGAISVFANPSPSRSFDFAGGWLLIKEAGGVFTDMNGDPIESAGIGLKKSVSLLASGNRRLHEKAMRLLHILNNT
jgi:myo-inositol-1(or 4)-monophosphatase